MVITAINRALLLHLLLLLLLPFRHRYALAEEIYSIESVPDLQKLMYMTVDGYPCVRLLNLSGEIGCSNPSRHKVVAPVIKFENDKELAEPHTVLVPMDKIQNFFSRVSKDISFARNIVGVLVDPVFGIEHTLKGFTPDKKFPQAEFAPYHNTNYQWNPNGSDIMWKAYNFSVYLLSESGRSTVQKILSKVEKIKNGQTADVAEFDMVMETTKAGTRNSQSCLQEETCLPLGGYSVWSSHPPISISNSVTVKPIVLTVASMDSASFFRDKSFGADSPISGMISLLAAVDALSRVDGFDSLRKQLVFLVLNGEAWGYLGSRRFLHELDLRSDAVNGLSSTSIETVLEIGSVGKGSSQGVNNFFAHKVGVSSGVNETEDALKKAQDSLRSENVTIFSADPSNPGIPPSSLMAFLKKNPQTSGIVLEDFDAEFTNKFYHSHLDDLSNINSSAIAAAASLVSRTLYILASDSKEISDSALSAISVNSSLVEELISCLLDCELGLSCDLVKNYISPTSTCPGNYVGVILGEPSYKPDPGYVSDVSRFVWNFLADRTSVPKENTAASGCSKGACSNQGEVCIKAELDGKGVCVNSTTRYVPAYSTRLSFNSGKWTVLPANSSSDPMGALDPVWTESNWNTIVVRVYTVQNSAYDRLVLLAGVTLTVLSYFGILAGRAFITKALKRD